ncbi:MAG TPA: hypothetical protein PKL31_04090 [Fulvivirga sp.]|nr:hypothetical protein [Fulvivirga sp.]
MNEFLSYGWQIVVIVFAIIGFLNTSNSFYKIYIKPEKPKLEIDFKISMFNRGDTLVITRFIKILNNSAKTAFRIKLYISNGENNLILTRDSLKPAQDPILHENKTEIDYQPTIEISDYLNNAFVIAQYKDDKGTTFYTRRNGMDNKSTLFATKKRPKDLDDFFVKVEKDEKDIK